MPGDKKKASPLGAAANRCGAALLLMSGVSGLGVFIAAHPLGLGWSALLTCAFCVPMLAHRYAWLLLIPGLSPVIDLAACTGAIYLTESDALVFAALLAHGVRGLWASAAGSRASAAPEPRQWAIGALPLIALLLLSASYLISTDWRPAWSVWTDPSLLVGYGPLNGLRLAKGMLLSVLLLPLLVQAMREAPGQALRMLLSGVLLGVLLVSLGAVWERLAFTGLTDFATDYRTTALFWEMNVGGAALDGWLALGLPFVLWAVLRERDPIRLGGLLCTLGVVAYAAFTTFSRGLYLGAAAGGALTLALMLRAAVRQEGVRIPLRAALGWSGFAAGCVLAMSAVFQTGGYRGLAAMLGLALAVFAAGPLMILLGRRDLLWAALVAGVASLLSILAMLWVPKGVYLAYGVSVVCFWMVLLLGLGERWATQAARLAFGSVLWMGFNAVLVTWYWSEGSGGLAGALGVGVLFGPLSLVRVRPQCCWRPDVQSGVPVLLVLGAVALIVVTFNTYYAGKRFETVAEDLEMRFQHWSLAASLPQGGREALIGVGVGQFAERYFWQVPDGQFPGSHHVVREEGQHFLRLGGPRHVLGFGELYRVSQRVSPAIEPPLLVSLNARAPEGDAAVHLEVCRKHLLYANECTGHEFKVVGGPVWQRFEFVLDRRDLGHDGGWLPKLTMFSVANASRGRLVEIDDLSLVDASGREHLDNGSFEAASDFWFFSSDRHHLPWHAKNLWLHYFVEQGWLGLLAFSVLSGMALLRVTAGAGAAHPLGPPLAGGLSGFFIVGAFDSLVDAPRLTVFALLLMFVALGLRGAHHR